MKKLIALSALTLIFAAPAWAATKTVTLSVPGMTCVTCPITEKREAVVTFDDAKTTVATLTEATKNAGYPSTVKP